MHKKEGMKGISLKRGYCRDQSPYIIDYVQYSRLETGP